MITSKQIKELAVKLQTAEINIAREYCQHLFLSNLYLLPESEKLLFKGGAALKMIFNSPRFSEDLDFTGADISNKKIENLLVLTLEKMNNFGVSSEILEAKTTSGGYLAVFSLFLKDFKINLQVEISKRQSKSLGEIFIINSQYLPPYSLVALKFDELILEKIQAVLSRQKPRDFFDIYFLLRSRFIKPKQKNHLKKISALLNKSKINFSNELKQFLPISLHKTTKNFKKILLDEIIRNI